MKQNPAHGAIDPLETLLVKLTSLQATLRDMDSVAFKNRAAQNLTNRLSQLRRQLEKGHRRPVEAQLGGLMDKVNGCVNAGSSDSNDWVQTCAEQATVYWSLHELNVLLAIEN